MIRILTISLLLGFLLIGFGQTQSRADDFAGIRDQIEVCDGCHGVNGASEDDAFPILAGQELHYLYVQLKDFQRGSRDNEVMTPILADIPKEDLLKLSEFYSLQKWPGIGFKGDPQQVAQGETAANSGQCVACHLGSYTGNSRIPRLAGQHPNYLEKTMLDMKTKVRNNAPAMSTLMSSFSESDIKAMAEYLGNM